MRILMVIAYRDFRDEEFFESKEFFEAHGYTVSVASSRQGMATSLMDRKVQTEIVIDKADPTAYDAILFVGGFGAKEFFHDHLCHEVIQEALSDGRVVGAICIAPLILAYAGVLEDRKATVSARYAQEIQALGATYTGQSVTADGNIVTADGPEAVEEFARTVIEIIEPENG